MWRRYTHFVRRTFLAGLLILIPLYVTYLLVTFLFELFAQVGAPIVNAVARFTGIDAPYEAPVRPEVRLHGASETTERSVAKLLDDFVEPRGFEDQRPQIVAAAFTGQLARRTAVELREHQPARVLPELRRPTEKLVLTANQVTVWQAARLAGHPAANALLRE